MFEGAAAFNGDVSGWDVSSVINMGVSHTHALDAPAHVVSRLLGLGTGGCAVGATCV